MNTDQILFEYFIRTHPLQATRLLERLKIEELVFFFDELPHHLVLVLFNHMGRHTAAKCLERMDIKRTVSIVENLPLQKVSIMLRQISNELREQILNAATDEISNPLRRILTYPEDTAAALADPTVLTLPDDISVRDALQHLQKYANNMIYYLYVVTQSQKLSGVISLRQLFLARPNKKVSECMKKDVVYVHAGFNFQAVINHPGWQNYHTLPVTDEKAILLGAIHYETLRRIESEMKKARLPDQAITASMALGELYQIGMSGLIRGAAAQIKDPSEAK